MQYLDLLLRNAKRMLRDRSNAAALAWTRTFLDHMWAMCPGPEEGEETLIPVYASDWREEWPLFRDNVRAVVWLAGHRGSPGPGRRRQKVPGWVRQVVDRYTARLRVKAVGRFGDEFRLV